MTNKLQLIRETLKKFDEELPPPADNSQISDLMRRSKESLGATPPEGYFQFLRRVNGLDFNGLMVYATSQAPDTEPDIPGFVEINAERFRGDLDGFERTLVFAEDSQRFYALNLDWNLPGGILARHRY